MLPWHLTLCLWPCSLPLPCWLSERGHTWANAMCEHIQYLKWPLKDTLQLIILHQRATHALPSPHLKLINKIDIISLKLQQHDINVSCRQRQCFPLITNLSKTATCQRTEGWANWMKTPFNVTLNLNNESGVYAGATSWPFHPSVEATTRSLSFHLTDVTSMTHIGQRRASRFYFHSLTPGNFDL